MHKLLTIVMAVILLGAMGLPAGTNVSICEKMHTIHLTGPCASCSSRNEPVATAKTEDEMPCCRRQAEAARKTPSPSPVQLAAPACCERQTVPANTSVVVDAQAQVKMLAMVVVPADCVALQVPPSLGPRQGHAARPPPASGPLYLRYCSLLA